MVFSAIARAGTNLTRKTFLQALSSTDYATAYGSRIHFTAEDQFGIDMVRVLRADPSCVLNKWGCMRPTSDWLPADAATATSIATG